MGSTITAQTQHRTVPQCYMRTFLGPGAQRGSLSPPTYVNGLGSYSPTWGDGCRQCCSSYFWITREHEPLQNALVTVISKQKSEPAFTCGTNRHGTAFVLHPGSMVQGNH